MCGKEKLGKFILLVLLATSCLFMFGQTIFAQWGRVGMQPGEDSRSLAFVDLGSGTHISLAGEKRFGVYYLKTVNGGTTWEQWQPTWLNEFQLYSSSGGAAAEVNSVVAVGQTAVAGTSDGRVYYSSDSANNYTTAWSQGTFTPSIAGAGIMDLIGAPGGHILACVSGGSNPGIYRSTDLGASFSLLAGTIGSGMFMSLAVDPNYVSNGEFWAVTEKGGPAGGVYQWTGAWNDKSPAGTHGYSSIAIAVVTGTINGIWVGDLHGSGIFETQNMGSTWAPRGSVCDPITSLFIPSDYTSANRHVLVGSGSGFFELKSGISYELYPKNLAINSIAEFPPASGAIWLATSSGVKKQFPGQTFPEGIQQEALALFDVSEIAPSPHFLMDNTVFALSERLGLFISRDGGASFQMYMQPLEKSTATDPGFKLIGFGPSPVYSGYSGSCNAEESTVYLATRGRGVFKSSSGGSNWVPINSGMSTELNMSVFAVTPNPYSYPLFAARDLFTSVLRFNPASGPAGAWETVLLSTPVPNKINIIAFPPTFNASGNPTSLDVFVGADTGLYISHDGGSTFARDNSLPAAPSGQTNVTGVAFTPSYGGSNQQVFIVMGGCLFKRVFTGSLWEWQYTGSSSFPGGEYHLDKLSISPSYGSDLTLAATFVNPQNFMNDGVWLSSNQGQNWTKINGTSPNELKDKYPLDIKFMGTNTGPRLLVGTRKERLFYSNNTNYSVWYPASGWETSPDCVNAVAVSTVPTPTTCGPAGSPGTDIFLGTCKGVFWSNDGGESFRPINEGLTSTISNNGCVPYAVNALYVVSALSGTSGVQPVLIAGTDGYGIWFRYAGLDPATGGWDWSTNPAAVPPEPVWHQAGGDIPATAKVYSFSREKNVTSTVTLQKVLRAATDSGAYSSSGVAGTIGQVWASMGLGGNVTGICHGVSGFGIKGLPDPKAPSGGTVWGTTWGTGVKKGTETEGFKGPTPETTTWVDRNGSGAGTIEEVNNWSIIQLTDGTLLAGGNSKGISRSNDEGLTLWYPSNGGLDSTSKKGREFLEVESNSDVFCAIEGSSSNGGIYLSADKGQNWVSISAGFDPDDQSLADIVETEGTPPVYYAGTFSHGTYATTITALDAPTITSLDVSTGASSGGTTVTITGTNFLCSCPTNYNCVSGRTQAIASFGGFDAATTSCSSTSLTVTTPTHLSGTVSVTVRNPDTRSATLTNAYTYTGESGAEIKLSRDTGNNIVVTWTGGTPGKVFRGINKAFTGYVKEDTLTSSPFTYDDMSDTSGTNGYTYFYKVE